MGIIKIETNNIKITKTKMNRAQNRMYRMIERFKENLNGMEIGEYFQVPIKIQVETEDVLNITCTFKFNEENFVKLELPFEVNCIVLSYLYQPSFAKYQIVIPDDYPFKPPVWILIHSNNEEKYKKVEIYQNVRYRNSWEPSISFEKDILYMIECMYIFKNK
jgi:hypothetical protein